MTMNKKETYRQLAEQVRSLVDGVDNGVGALANVAALLKEQLPYYFWVGFYIVRNGELQLGPFQGPVACYSIAKGRGVCGKAWADAQTLVVADVHQFPGHIACSSRSNSEIVVPVIRGNEVVAVIDVDSEQFGAFDEDDKAGLEAIAEILEQDVTSCLNLI
jgi:L-methionine (R)-S-oxide reductase